MSRWLRSAMVSADVHDRYAGGPRDCPRAVAALALFALLLAGCGGGSSATAPEPGSTATPQGVAAQAASDGSKRTPATNGRVNPTDIPLSPAKQVPYSLRGVLASADP